MAQKKKKRLDDEYIENDGAEKSAKQELPNITSVANWIFLVIWLLVGLLVAKWGMPGAYGCLALALAVSGAWIMTRDSSILSLTVVAATVCYSFGFLEMSLNGESLYSFIYVGAAMLLSSLYVIFIQQGRYDYKTIDIVVCTVAFVLISANAVLGVLRQAKYCTWVTRAFVLLLLAVVILKIIIAVKNKIKGVVSVSVDPGWKSKRRIVLCASLVIFVVFGLLSRLLPPALAGFLFLAACIVAGLFFTGSTDPRTRIVNILMVFFTIAVMFVITLPAQESFEEALSLAGEMDSFTHVHLTQPLLDLLLLCAARIGAIYETVVGSLFIFIKPLLALAAKIIPRIDPAWILEPNTVLRGAFCWMTCFICTMIGVYAGAFINRKTGKDMMSILRSKLPETR